MGDTSPWLGRWKEAADAYAKGMSAKPIGHEWAEYASVLVLAGDDAEYRRFCGRIAEHVKTPGTEADWIMLSIATPAARISPASGIAAERSSAGPTSPVGSTPMGHGSTTSPAPRDYVFGARRN